MTTENTPAARTSRINMKPIPLVATVFFVLALMVGGALVSLSEESPTSIGDGIGLGAAIIFESLMVSSLALLCAIFSVISIFVNRQWRAWSCVMLALCLAWFVYVVWQINS